jgi:hypothetical protein
VLVTRVVAIATAANELARSGGLALGRGDQRMVNPAFGLARQPRPDHPGWTRRRVTIVLKSASMTPTTLRLLDPRQAGTGNPLPDLVPIDVIRVGELPTRSTQNFSPPIQLGGIALVGADWAANDAAIRPGETVAPGATLQLGLTWEAQQRRTADSVAFVHLVGPDGTLVAQHDKPPLDGWIPMREWAVDQRLRDEFTLTLPADAPAGEYTLYTGFYDRVTGVRLPVRQGEVDQGDAYRLGELQVTP